MSIENRYQSPQERERRHKESDAWAEQRVRPVIDSMSESSVILALENALEELQEMSSIDQEPYERILGLVQRIREEADIEHAMAEVQ